MITIFEQGHFDAYSNISLNESRSSIPLYSDFSMRKTTIFISHNHDDLDDLKGVLGFLERTYDVKVYIDSRDPMMPKVTSMQTALNIRERIKQCDKFIFLATNGAIESKWCNWELGYGDAQKYRDHIALFPLKPKGTYDWEYKGSEYMSIYPYVSYYNGTEKYMDGNSISRGYYISMRVRNSTIIIPLVKWLKSR